MNRLGLEKSPYLLQHAGNPVDWYPWGPEAFLKAEQEARPVFVSIGYSTCHWCHVMEEESFENPEVAAALNRDFISIKVDREERPDIDSAYMNAVHAMGGAGGWPLNVFLAPDKRPFYGGTYFTPGQLKELLPAISDAWKNKRGELAGFSARLLEALSGPPAPEKGAIAGEAAGGAFGGLLSMYDPAFGGFGAARKFPSAHTLSFMLLHYYRTGSKEALEMAENTLGHISGGGITDHLGGGIHRYSTDRAWFLPHFEKMLYDQALIAGVYLEAYQLTRKRGYADAARKVLDYALRGLGRPGGGFASAEDADSAPDPARPGEKREGAYYVWTRAGILDVLGAGPGEMFCWRYGVKAEGNVSADPRGEFPGKNVLSVVKTVKETAARFRKSEKETEKALRDSAEKLFRARSLRPGPYLDDKVLTDWNGLMISSLAKAGGILGEPKYLAAAGKAAAFILEELRAGDGTLLHRYRDGSAGIPGFLDDYAFFINGLLDLYEASFSVPYLERAVELGGKLLELFEDKAGGGFFMTAAGAETLPGGRAREYLDGALPSGNSMAALCLARLANITRRKDLGAACAASLARIPGLAARAPASFPQLLIAADAAGGRAIQAAIVSGTGEDRFAAESAAFLRGRFLPGRTLLLRRTGKKADGVLDAAPWLGGLETLPGGRTAVYVCVDRVCLPPAADLAGLEKYCANG
ncbi:MAG: thioredoxin domain-containing protein [Elusimicrobia bacterium]|nr:thioredoxin domain-containing protein [Elusimicrobiota bacterium]